MEIPKGRAKSIEQNNLRILFLSLLFLVSLVGTAHSTGDAGTTRTFQRPMTPLSPVMLQYRFSPPG